MVEFAIVAGVLQIDFVLALNLIGLVRRLAVIVKVAILAFVAVAVLQVVLEFRLCSMRYCFAVALELVN